MGARRGVLLEAGRKLRRAKSLERSLSGGLIVVREFWWRELDNLQKEVRTGGRRPAIKAEASRGKGSVDGVIGMTRKEKRVRHAPFPNSSVS